MSSPRKNVGNREDHTNKAAARYYVMNAGSLTWRNPEKVTEKNTRKNRKLANRVIATYCSLAKKGRSIARDLERLL